MTIAKLFHVSEGQYAEAMGDRLAEASPAAEIPMPKREVISRQKRPLQNRRSSQKKVSRQRTENR